MIPQPTKKKLQPEGLLPKVFWPYPEARQPNSGVRGPWRVVTRNRCGETMQAVDDPLRPYPHWTWGM